MENDKLVWMSDAISAILEEKNSGQQLEIMRVLGTGMQAETLNQACDRHAQYIRGLSAVDAVEVVRCRECLYRCNSFTGCPKLHGLETPDDFFCKYGKPKN